MNDKAKEELNRWCHKFMGYCLSRNEDCGCTPRDYTDSLDLASIVEAKAIERVGEVHMADCLHNICSHEYFARFAENKLIEWHPWAAIAFASAETRCKAARAVVEGEA